MLKHLHPQMKCHGFSVKPTLKNPQVQQEPTPSTHPFPHSNTHTQKEKQNIKVHAPHALLKILSGLCICCGLHLTLIIMGSAVYHPPQFPIIIMRSSVHHPHQVPIIFMESPVHHPPRFPPSSWGLPCTTHPGSHHHYRGPPCTTHPSAHHRCGVHCASPTQVPIILMGSSVHCPPQVPFIIMGSSVHHPPRFPSSWGPLCITRPSFPSSSRDLLCIIQIWFLLPPLPCYVTNILSHFLLSSLLLFLTVHFVSSQFYTSWLCKKQSVSSTYCESGWLGPVNILMWSSQRLLFQGRSKTKCVIRVSQCLFLLFRIRQSRKPPFLNAKDHFVSPAPGSKQFSDYLFKQNLPVFLSQVFGG